MHEGESTVSESRLVVTWVLTDKGLRSVKRHEETFRADGCAHNVDRGDDLTGVYLSRNLTHYAS